MKNIFNYLHPKSCHNGYSVVACILYIVHCLCTKISCHRQISYGILATSWSLVWWVLVSTGKDTHDGLCSSMLTVGETANQPSGNTSGRYMSLVYVEVPLAWQSMITTQWLLWHLVMLFYLVITANEICWTCYCFGNKFLQAKASYFRWYTLSVCVCVCVHTNCWRQSKGLSTTATLFHAAIYLGINTCTHFPLTRSYVPNCMNWLPISVQLQNVRWPIG